MPFLKNKNTNPAKKKKKRRKNSNLTRIKMIRNKFGKFNLNLSLKKKFVPSPH